MHILFEADKVEDAADDSPLLLGTGILLFELQIMQRNYTKPCPLWNIYYAWWLFAFFCLRPCLFKQNAVFNFSVSEENLMCSPPPMQYKSVRIARSLTT